MVGRALVVVLCAVALAPALASARTAASPSCATSALVVWLNTAGNGAAGSVYYRIEFTNLSGRTCHLFGYPGVSAVDLTGHQLGNPAARNRMRPPRSVTLRPDHTATAILQIVDADNFPRSTCRQQTAAGLRVFPPGQRAARVVPFPFRACSRRGPVYVRVEAIR